MDIDPLPDYYAILQVHPSAEPEIIEVAYRRLMRKYHPDALPPELRADPDVLSRVRAINLAYDILSDPALRAVYDAALLPPQPKPDQKIDPNIETRIHVVRCANTSQKFRMLLGKHKKKGKIYRVLGFEPFEFPGEVNIAQTDLASLPAPTTSVPWWKRLFSRNQKKQPFDASLVVQPQKLPTLTSINHQFLDGPDLNFTEIDFSGMNCPACNGEYTSPVGGTSNWIRCNACKHIFCAGNVRVKKLGEFTRCPWCGRFAHISKHTYPGSSENLPVKGEIGRSISRPGPRKLNKRDDPKLHD